MKLWPTTTKNKCFVKMLWHLLGECVKTTILLICSICTFFFLIIDLCSFFLYIKARMCVQCFCTVHLVFLRCTSTTPFCWASICFLIFFLKFWTVATVPSWFNQLCWGKIHYSTYNFFGLTFCIFFSLHTILNKNT